MTVGETLSDARRAHGLSVDDVATETCIRGTLIYAIEADNYAMCGGAVYARGHIRSIAHVVGVDAGPLIAEFDAAVGEVKVPAVASGQTPDRVRVRRSPPAWPAWQWAAGATAAAVVAAVVIAVLHGLGGGSGSHHKQSASTPVATRRVSPSPVPLPQESSPTVVPPALGRASLKIRTPHGATWLTITTKSGRVLYDGLVPAGEQRAFHSPHGLTYVIGYAPAVDIVINGTDIGSPPATGLVARGKVRPDTSAASTA